MYTLYGSVCVVEYKNGTLCVEWNSWKPPCQCKHVCKIKPDKTSIMWEKRVRMFIYAQLDFWWFFLASPSLFGRMHKGSRSLTSPAAGVFTWRKCQRHYRTHYHNTSRCSSTPMQFPHNGAKGLPTGRPHYHPLQSYRLAHPGRGRRAVMRKAPPHAQLCTSHRINGRLCKKWGT